MRILNAISVIIFLIYTSTSVNAQFNNVKLGMSLDELTEIMGESDRIKDDGSGVTKYWYDNKLDGRDVKVYFEILNDEVISNTVSFEHTHTTEEFYFFYYNRINQILENKYGQSKSEVVNVEYPLTTETLVDGEEYSEYFLIVNNFKFYLNVWGLEDMEIRHALIGSFGEIGQLISYKVNNYDELIEKQLIDQF